MVTWKCAGAPSTTWPRISDTSNQSRLCSVRPARARPLRIAVSMPSGDVPTISTFLYVRSAMAGSFVMSALRVVATVLPEGTGATELWVRDGVFSDVPAEGAEDVPGRYVLPGLVDAHAH